MAIKTPQEKFLHELGDVYDAEQRFLEGQSTMLEAATDPTLKGGIQKHIAESQQQVANLRQVFQLLGAQAKGEPCDAAKGLVAEAQKNVKEAGRPEIRDCLIGGALAKVEHYEIASYRGLILGAQEMGQNEVAALLQQNLRQEEQTAQRLETSAPLLLRKATQVAA
jgi:ferritin-like metal-binding protein YciE